jgi:hypothetical protein
MGKWYGGGLGENWRVLGSSRGTPGTTPRHHDQFSPDLVLLDIRKSLCQHFRNFFVAEMGLKFFLVVPVSKEKKYFTMNLS